MYRSKSYKLLILISVALVTAFALLYIFYYDVLTKKTGTGQANIYEPTNQDDTVEKHYTKHDSIKVDLKGLRNDTIQLQEEIIEIIASELNGFNWNEEFQDKDLYGIYHETVFAQPFPSDRANYKKLIVITYSNHVGNLCHAARGRMSLFEFRKEHQNWQMTRKYLAFEYGDEYGLEPVSCELVQIGNHTKYAVIVQTSYSGNGGHEIQTQSVYAEVNNAFELVFDFTSYEYYNEPPEGFEYTEGTSTMRIVKSNKTWFDIETKSEDTEWDDKTPGSVKWFEFNGKEYIEVK